MIEPDCFICRNTADPNPPDREQVLRSRHWRAAHAFDTALPGWLILTPTTHVAALDELSADAAAELGPILRDVTSALKTVTGCVKTYVLLLAEQAGFAHLHFHVVPRASALADDHKGTGVFRLLGVSADEQVPREEQDRIARALRRELAR